MSVSYSTNAMSERPVMTRTSLNPGNCLKSIVSIISSASSGKPEEKHPPKKKKKKTGCQGRHLI